MLEYVNHADPISHRYTQLNKNFQYLLENGGSGGGGNFTPEEKAKLATIEEYANNFSLPSGLAGQVLKHNGTMWVAGKDNDTTYSNATQNSNGLMSAVDKVTIDSLDSTYIPQTAVGIAPDQLPTTQQLGQLAFMDNLGRTQVQQNIPDSKPGDVWYEYTSDTTLVKKFHGFDGVVRSLTENYE